MQHRTHALLSVALLASAFPLLHLFAQPPTRSGDPESAAAKKARATYLKEIDKIEGDASDRFTAARKKYATELDEARKEALTNSDLNEAQRILAAKNAVLATDPAPAAKRLTIISAKFGAEGNWADVTPQVRKMMKNNRLTISFKTKELNDTFPDPAFGKLKTVVVAYSYGNRVSMAIMGPDDKLDLPAPEPKKDPKKKK